MIFAVFFGLGAMELIVIVVVMLIIFFVLWRRAGRPKETAAPEVDRPTVPQEAPGGRTVNPIWEKLVIPTVVSVLVGVITAVILHFIGIR